LAPASNNKEYKMSTNEIIIVTIIGIWAALMIIEYVEAIGIRIPFVTDVAVKLNSKVEAFLEVAVAIAGATVVVVVQAAGVLLAIALAIGFLVAIIAMGVRLGGM
jgi:flagellar biosynthesis protein FliQ